MQIELISLRVLKEDDKYNRGERAIPKN